MSYKSTGAFKMVRMNITNNYQQSIVSRNALKTATLIYKLNAFHKNLQFYFVRNIYNFYT